MKTNGVYRVRTLKTYWQIIWVCCMALLGVMPMGCGSGVEDNWEFHDPEVEYYTDDGSDEGLTPSVEDFEKAAATTYYLPFHSGETFRADTYSGHNAWDFNKGSGSDDCGEPVVAVTNGRIVAAVASTDYNCYPCSNNPGNYVKLDHDSDSNVSHYYHLKQVFVQNGQWVERGQVLGTLGNTGNAQGCHLHYEVRNSSNAQITNSLQFYYNGGQSTLVSGKSYTSTNAGKMDGAFSRNGGSAKMGSASPALASRVAYDGYVKYYNGGSYGECAIYYEALGCGGGDFCPSYNNSNFAWLVRTGFYNWYKNCGGPQTCWLGFPTGDEFPVSGGAKQTFEYGYLLFTSSNGQVTAYRY